MKNPYMFLTIIVHGLKNPKNGIDAYLQLLVVELKNRGWRHCNLHVKGIFFRMYAFFIMDNDRFSSVRDAL